jgi:aryl-alcohol dehydrogenase-like predicted oxidoreductase
MAETSSTRSSYHTLLVVKYYTDAKFRANNYQGEESEAWIGDWMEERGLRDEMVIATKYTTCYPAPGPKAPKILANYQGQHTKSLHLSVEASLKKLKTSYIDLLYIHWWDFTASHFLKS